MVCGPVCLSQLLSLHTFGKDSCEDVLRALNEADPPNVLAAWVACVPRTFHPVFQVRSTVCINRRAPMSVRFDNIYIMFL